ncbi:hypothetical protein F4821DRAFT_282049 [Hypoxylon rubiginosum]|uniref:Uncharacterized protein n=1 Tax=Hypoxylon rubiginosum TaxID=110542 RepID=A0ACC0CNS4_9PEZI|nr:hypothetical protein F4821DRAFT_282049 [Hypoxylon rubiginosum]
MESALDYVSSNTALLPVAHRELRTKMHFLSHRERQQIRSPVPIDVVLDGEDAIILAGKFHGVTVGTEFTCFELLGLDPITAYAVADVRCKARLKIPITGETTVYFSRWSSEKRLEVLVDPSFAGDFIMLLREALRERISSEIEIIKAQQGDEMLHSDTNSVVVRRRGPTGVDIIWPRAHQSREPLPGLKIEHLDLKEQVARSAAALAHIFRFFQLEDLKDAGALDGGSLFHISAWNLKERFDSGDTVKERFDSGDTVKETENKIQLWFTNTSAQNLYFMIIKFNAAFEVRTVYPLSGYPQTIEAGESTPYTFTVDLEKELDGKGPYRNVLRVVVFDKPDIPDIPCVDYLDEGRTITPGYKHNHTWWIDDMEIFIDPKSNSQGCITS